MYKVTICMSWGEEYQARIWCVEQDFLYRLEDTQSGYKDTFKADTEILPSLKIKVSGSPIDRTFCFMKEEDALAFKLRWL